MPREPKQLRWTCSGLDSTELANIMGENYQVEPIANRFRDIELYDSFDRPFASMDQSLVRSGGIFSVISGDDLIDPQATSSRKINHRRPVYWWDFEAGDFQSLLKSRLKLRAAVPLASATLEETHFSVRNEDQKIVLRLWIRTMRSGDKVLAQELTASPLVGYNDQTAKICRCLSKSLTLSDPSIGIIRSIYDLVQVPAALPIAKAPIAIEPHESVQSAVTRIASTMLKIARHSEAGMIDDIDTEFLHDYRVSIRKLRSVVSLVKGAYPAAERRLLKSEFGDHAKATNRLRDLDVYLLDESSYRERIPENLRAGLDRMFADFRRDRTRELGKLRRRLRSKKYLDTMQRRTDWLNGDALPEGERSQQEIGKVVSREIHRHYRHIRKLGLALTDQTPDEEVHEMRIECKRLRYLLELFASLFNPASLRKILQRLKGLQNVLGDFNDFSVQSLSMESYLKSSAKMDRPTSAAVGALIAVLHGEQIAARAKVAERFHQFCDGKMRQRFKTLFADLQTSEP